jgi:hypothetical protein
MTSIIGWQVAIVCQKERERERGREREREGKRKREREEEARRVGALLGLAVPHCPPSPTPLTHRLLADPETEYK